MLYDCVDYFAGYKNPLDNVLALQEKRLIQKAAYFFVNSQALSDVHRKIRKPVVVPQGFRIDEFQKPVSPIRLHVPAHKPVIGYVGGINYLLDYALLIRLITKTPHYTYVFIGPVQENDPEYFQKHIRQNIQALFSLPNVYHRRTVSKEKIPSVISAFDIAMIPYDIRFSFNTYCYPMKLFEYFYTGKPVVSTPIVELKRFPTFVKIGSAANEWEKHIASLLAHSWPKEYQKAQRKLAEENSWEKKINAIFDQMSYDTYCMYTLARRI